MAKRTDIKKILIIGSGPIIIGQVIQHSSVFFYPAVSTFMIASGPPPPIIKL